MRRSVPAGPQLSERPARPRGHSQGTEAVSAMACCFIGLLVTTRSSPATRACLTARHAGHSHRIARVRYRPSQSECARAAKRGAGGDPGKCRRTVYAHLSVSSWPASSPCQPARGVMTGATHARGSSGRGLATTRRGLAATDTVDQQPVVPWSVHVLPGRPRTT
jgi:hypothetical protein